MDNEHRILFGVVVFALGLALSGCDAILIGREAVQDSSTSAPRLEGEDLTAITSDEYLYEHPKWSPDGTMIAVARNMESQAIMGPALSDWDVVVFDEEGTQILLPPAREGTAFWSPDWSPDGQSIAMIAFDGDINRILIHELSTQIDREVSCPSCDYPVWSAAGRQILAGALFGSGSEDRPDFGILTLDAVSGKINHELVLGTQFLDAFTLSPDGGSALIADVECSGIWQISFESGELSPLIDDPGLVECDPAYSANGAKVAYTVFDPEGRSSFLAVANADGSNPVELLKVAPASYDIRHPAWSPDGTRLTFVYGTFGVTSPGYSTLYVIDVPPELQP